MNSRKSKTILTTITSIAIIFAIGNGCRARFNSINYGNGTTDKSAASKSRAAKTQEYISFTQNGLRGVKDTQGNVVIPAQYDKIDSISMQPNYAIVTRNDLQGLIDLKEKGNTLLSLEYDQIDPVKPDLDGFYVDGHLNGKLGLRYFDAFTYAIPQEYDRISYVNPQQNYSIVTKDRQTGVYDLKSDLFTPLKYDEIELISYDEYTRYVSSQPKANLKIVKDKAIILANEGHKTRLLLQGFSSTRLKYLMVTKNNREGILNIDNGKPLIPIEYDSIRLHPDNNKYAIVTKAGKSGILNIDNGKPLIPIEYDSIRLNRDNIKYAIATKDGKSGIIDTHNGKTIIPIEYDTIEWNSNTTDYAIVTKAGKSGILNTHNGKTIIPIEYDSIEWNSHTADYAIATKENQPSILDIKNNKFIPVKSDELDSFSLHNGYAIFTQGGKEGIVNLKGDVIIPAKYVINDKSLIENKYLIASRNQRRGFLNVRTKKFTAFKDDTIGSASDERLVWIKSGGSNVEPGYLIIYNFDAEGVIDLQGNTIVPLSEYQTIEGYRDGVVLTRRKIIPGEFGDSFSEFNTTKPIIPSRTNGKVKNSKETNNDSQDLFIDDVAVLMVDSGKYFCGIDRQGKLLFKAQSDSWGEGEKIDNLCRSLVGIEVDNNSVDRDSQHGDYEGLVRDGFIRIYVNDKYGYANAKGEVVIYPQFDRAENFFNGLAKAYRDYKWGLIDRTGEFVLEPQFDNISDFKEGLAVVEQDDKYGYVDRTGKIIIKPQFDYALDFKKGLAEVQQDDKYGYVDRTGKIIIKPQFDSIYGFEEGLARVKQDDKWGYVDRMGKIVIKPQFDDAENFDNGVAGVRKGNLNYAIDNKGKFIFNLQNLKNIYLLIM